MYNVIICLFHEFERIVSLNNSKDFCRLMLLASCKAGLYDLSGALDFKDNNEQEHAMSVN